MTGAAGAGVPLAWATVLDRGEKRRAVCQLLGKPTKVRGQLVAVEVQVMEESARGWRGTDRFTMVETKSLSPLNELAWALVRPDVKVA